MNDGRSARVATGKPWVRIPDGIKVRHRLEGLEGVISGLTEMVAGSSRNPDGRTQYRVNVGAPTMKLAAEDDLMILTDQDKLVMMDKQKADYRGGVTEYLHRAFADDRFVAATSPFTGSAPTEAARKVGDEAGANEKDRQQ